jgi:hypothetical protein
MTRDLCVVAALLGLFLSPVLPASAGVPLCTADGRKDAPDAPKGCAHLLCERGRRDS